MKTESPDPRTIVWFNGRFVPLAEANVNILTHALNYGTGVFEGIRGYYDSIKPISSSSARWSITSVGRGTAASSASTSHPPRPISSNSPPNSAAATTSAPASTSGRWPISPRHASASRRTITMPTRSLSSRSATTSRRTTVSMPVSSPGAASKTTRFPAGPRSAAHT